MTTERTELHLRAMLDSALDGIVSMDHLGRVVEFNRAAEEQFGIRRADALGRDVGELIVPPKYRDAHRQGLERFLAAGESRIIGERVRMSALRADGSEFPCELSVTLSTATAQPVFTAYIRDVTEQESAEEALRQSQRTLMTLMSNLPGMAYRCPDDEYGRMQFISEGCQELTGYDAEALIENPDLAYKDLIHPDDRERVFREVQKALAEREPFQVLYRIRTKDGAEKWVLERGRGIYSVFSTTNEVIAIEGFTTDFTERKRAEELLSEYSERLRSEVAERTKELNERNKELRSALEELRRTHDQLIMQEKLASLGQLTAGIAHEIKNPLNFVNNFAELTVELAGELGEAIASQNAEEVQEIVQHLTTNAQKIRDHGKRADSIMRSMLMLSRKESAQREPTDLNALLDEDLNLAYHGMRALDKTFNVTFERDFDENVGKVEIVPQDVGRVFLNLLNNACQAVHEKKKTGGPAYTPIVRAQTKTFDDLVEVRVWDNGPGIPAGVRDEIFNPFFTTKPAGQGTGLGLSISYEIIVQKHGGTLEVNSEPGEFTEFVISLPRTARDAA